MQGLSTTLIGNHIHDSNGGQNVKLRSGYAVLLYNRIENAGNYEIDLIQNPPTTDAPNSNAVLIGNTVLRPATSGNNSQVILFGSDNGGVTGRNGNLYAVNNTFILANASNRLFHALAPAPGSQIFLTNNIITATVSGTALAIDATTAGLIQGTNNWINSDVTASGNLLGTVTGTDPGFVSATDFHLTAASAARDIGAANPSYVDNSGATQSAVPTLEFAAPQGTSSRPFDCTLDDGAYEYDTGVSCDGGTTVPDSGSPGSDGGAPSPDGGSTRPDAGGGSPDGGSSGSPDGGGGTAKAGCSCNGADGVAMALMAAVGAFALRRRRAR
jgi:MYXO-CTERM domain-containing protein